MAKGIDIAALDFSKPRVRYKGKVEDNAVCLTLSMKPL